MHAEFLGYGTRRDMLTTYFVHDSANTSDWRLKKHAQKEFWRWVATWAACVSKPSDLGYPDDGFNLPPLNIETVEVRVDEADDTGNELFRAPSMSSASMHKEMRLTCSVRASKAAEIVSAAAGPVVVWCNTNYEADELVKLLPEALEVRGSDSPEAKEEKLRAFTFGSARVIITKPGIAGHGLNWQHCNRHVFVGLSYSFEEFYQAIRRGYRFGQSRPFTATVIQAQTEGPIKKAILEKIERHDRMREEMKLAAKSLNMNQKSHSTMKTGIEKEQGESWTVYHGDCVRVAQTLPDESVDFSIYSPPFAALYVYSSDPQDMGNCATDDDFIDQYRYLLKEHFRMTKPGRIAAVHCADITAQLWKDGVIGLKDLTGMVIAAHQECGWIYHSRVTIWKDPVVEMQRTKALGLLYKQLRKDSTRSRVGNPDYLIIFRKPGENPEPVEHTPDEYPLDQWQKDASPVWMDVNQTNVLNNEGAREVNDERHIAPLQLDVIRRALRLWSNPGDMVYSPFAGIGSEGFCAVEMGRCFVGSELKRSYFTQAIQWLRRAQAEMPMFKLGA